MELSRGDLVQAAGDLAAQRRDQLAKVEREIRQAQAEALGRLGERLQALLDRVAAMDRDLDAVTLAPGAGQDLAAASAGRREAEVRNRLRDEAARLRHDLIIQREALGLRRHAEVEQCYPVPARRPWGPPGGDRKGPP
jgi:hypothetical protein